MLIVGFPLNDYNLNWDSAVEMAKNRVANYSVMPTAGLSLLLFFNIWRFGCTIWHNISSKVTWIVFQIYSKCISSRQFLLLSYAAENLLGIYIKM